MAIYQKTCDSYSLVVEQWVKDDEVIIKREYRDFYGAIIKQHCRVHKSMIPGLIEDLEKFINTGDTEDES